MQIKVKSVPLLKPATAAGFPQRVEPPPSSQPIEPPMLLPPNKSSVSAPSILLMGPPGSGKTFSVATLLAAGIEVFYLATEPNAIDVILDVIRANDLDLEKFHWHYIPPSTATWDSLIDLTRQVNTMTYQGLTDIKSGIAKRDSTGLGKLLAQCNNFHDQRTGKDFGDVTTWGPGRALVIDSLSGMNLLAQYNTVGLKPALSPGEWGVAMTLESFIINKLTADTNCFFILIAHIDRVVSEVTGAMIISPAALGSKLGPKLGQFFSEVVLAVKRGDEFFWSTSEQNTDTKQRTLPISSKLPPSFIPVVEAYKARQGLVTLPLLGAPRDIDDGDADTQG